MTLRYKRSPGEPVCFKNSVAKRLRSKIEERVVFMRDTLSRDRYFLFCMVISFIVKKRFNSYINVTREC